MTKSQFIREQIKPLIDVLKPFMNPEDDPEAFKRKIELWALRLVIDSESMCCSPDDIKPEDF